MKAVDSVFTLSRPIENSEQILHSVSLCGLKRIFAEPMKIVIFQCFQLRPLRPIAVNKLAYRIVGKRVSLKKPVYNVLLH